MLKFKGDGSPSDMRRRPLQTIFLGCALGVASVAVSAGAAVDCPLRDAKYSVESPLVDVLLKPEAKVIVANELKAASRELPPQLDKTVAPTFAAIISVSDLVHMVQLDDSVTGKIDKQLRKLKVNDSDRVARCARYDNERPEFDLPEEGRKVLIFHKINGFDHGPSVAAATNAISSLAEQLGWSVAVTDKGGAFVPELLSQFDAVVWNNVSGDVLTRSQRKAFEDYVNNGGGFIGIHGSGGDTIYLWDWYANSLLGARFIGHPADPQFQNARVKVEDSASGIGQSLKPGWMMKDEWYSFRESARMKGADVIATLDETTYLPFGRHGQDLRMGDDHPIVWTRCVGKGRAFYSAIGHRPEVYYVPENLVLLKSALAWAGGADRQSCPAR